MPYKKIGRFYYRHGKRYTGKQVRAIYASEHHLKRRRKRKK